LKLSGEEAKLYELIRTRTIQSQMPPAIYDVQLLKFQTSSDLGDIWETKVETLNFP
jgi:DNA topoisomerase IA